MAGTTELCLEVNDLALFKYIAGRPKNLDFTGEMARLAMTDFETSTARLNETEDERRRELASIRISRDF